MDSNLPPVPQPDLDLETKLELAEIGLLTVRKMIAELNMRITLLQAMNNSRRTESWDGMTDY